MRVITGKVKGHHLKFPKGTKTRPVTDLMRGAIFSILDNIVDDWSLVLDLFAGSGALGIEALSRGAGWVDFVEKERRCCDIIRENLAATRFTQQARVLCCSANRAFSLLGKEYNVILMDPPYANPDTSDIITRLGSSTLVGAKTTLAVTHSARSSIDQSYGTLTLIKETCHGDSCIAIFQKEAKP